MLQCNELWGTICFFLLELVSIWDQQINLSQYFPLMFVFLSIAMVLLGEAQFGGRREGHCICKIVKRQETPDVSEGNSSLCVWQCLREKLGDSFFTIVSLPFQMGSYSVHLFRCQDNYY